MRLVLFLLFSISLNCLSQTNCTTISDGTYGNSQTSPFAPLYGLYNYSWSSSIYYASEIGASKTIASINWYIDEYQSGYSQTGPYTFSNIKIYFAYTTLSGWGNTNNVSGLNRLTGVNSAQGITSWTKVYDGSITFNTVNAWKSIALDAPFSYDGLTNLVVHVENWDGSWASGYPIFHYTSMNTATLNRTMKYGAQDASMGPTSGARYYARPDIKFCTATVLPIELMYFKPYYEDDRVKLKWVTASEHDNDYFTVEKSIDGYDYEPIITVKGAGNSQSINKYYAEDFRLSSDVIYYRLKQTDMNGTFTRTDWHSVKIDYLFSDITVYPNPISEELNISFNYDLKSNQTLYISDIFGNIVFEKDLELKPGTNNFKIELPTLSKGVYFLKMNELTYKLEK